MFEFENTAVKVLKNIIAAQKLLTFQTFLYDGRDSSSSPAFFYKSFFRLEKLSWRFQEQSMPFIL